MKDNNQGHCHCHDDVHEHGAHGHNHEHPHDICGCGHEHSHAESGCCADETATATDELKALIHHMKHHNEHHAEDINSMCAKAEALGIASVAEALRKSSKLTEELTAVLAEAEKYMEETTCV